MRINMQVVADLTHNGDIPRNFPYFYLQRLNFNPHTQDVERGLFFLMHGEWV